jgi:hypothetical protein
MSTITTLVGTDGITTGNSMTKINTNFSNLNTDKIETSTLDTDTTLAANSDSKIPTQKAVKAYVDAGGNVNASETTRGIVEEATDAEVSAGTATGATGAKLFVTPAKLRSGGVLKFGGTGSDGALSISSGTTTIDLANAQVVTKNYTSISITGTGKLAFSNPHTNGTIVIIKSQGNVIFTSSQTPMIDLSGIGGSIGTAGYYDITSPGAGGSGGGWNGGANGGGSGGGGGGGALTAGSNGIAEGTTAGGTGGTTTGIKTASTLYFKTIKLSTGAGGGNGGTFGQGTGGAGGRGGGSLYVECGGALNFTTISGISVAGVNGSNGVRGADSNCGGGGGGGGGGSAIILYNTLIANTGTIIVSGGTKGSGAPPPVYGGADGGNGGDGYSLITQNTEFT